jgi:hypothetical protein
MKAINHSLNYLDKIYNSSKNKNGNIISVQEYYVAKQVSNYCMEQAMTFFEYWSKFFRLSHDKY